MSPTSLTPSLKNATGFFIAASADEAVEPARVLANDLLAHGRGQVAELALDELARVGPHAIGMGKVRAPHDGVVPEIVDEVDADAVGLVRGLALAAPVFARPHRQREVRELVLPLRVHALEHVRDPADAALADDEDDPRVAFEHAPEDQ